MSIFNRSPYREALKMRIIPYTARVLKLARIDRSTLPQQLGRESEDQLTQRGGLQSEGSTASEVLADATARVEWPAFTLTALSEPGGPGQRLSPCDEVANDHEGA